MFLVVAQLFLTTCYFLNDDNRNGDGVGGVLGFLLNSYSRPGDNLPVSSNVFFERDDFEFMKQEGKIGMSDVSRLSLFAVFRYNLRHSIYFPQKTTSYSN